MTSVFTVKMANHYGTHICHVEKNDPIAFILPCRWQNGAESLQIETVYALTTTDKCSRKAYDI